MNPLRRVTGFLAAESARHAQLLRAFEETRMLAARQLVHTIRQRGVLPSIHEAEFKVSSQFGDDGIIQYLVHLLDIQPRTFIEFGVEDYQEANTRFLLQNNNWSGLVMDGSSEAMERLRSTDLYWRYDVNAVAAMITRENIDSLIQGAGFGGDLGILSIDIDGNDYWVWEAMTSVNPTLVIVEYNAIFGPHRAVVVPYDPAFQRSRAHYSHLYCGASLAALCRLANNRGFAFVGSNTAGNNAYFVRRDRLGPLRELTALEGYVESRFRESRGPDGNLTFLRGTERVRQIREMPVVDVEAGREIPISEILPEG